MRFSDRATVLRLVLAAKSAALATMREDDPANLPTDILHELEVSAAQAEDSILGGVVPFEFCACCAVKLEGPEQQERGWCSDCDLSDDF